VDDGDHARERERLVALEEEHGCKCMCQTNIRGRRRRTGERREPRRDARVRSAGGEENS
jgi:hypothetical protein